MCIFPPHSRMIPMILGCGTADRTLSDLVYRAYSNYISKCSMQKKGGPPTFSFLLFPISEYIWISIA